MTKHFKKNLITIFLLIFVFILVGILLFKKRTSSLLPTFTMPVKTYSVQSSDFSREYEKKSSPSGERFAIIFDEDCYGIAIFTNTKDVGLAYVSESYPFRPISNLRWINETTVEYEIFMSPSHGVLITLDLSNSEVIKAVPKKEY